MNQGIDRSREALDVWLPMLERARLGDYVPLAGFQQLSGGSGVETDSRLWSERFFSSGAGPYAAGVEVKRSVHATTADTVDVLRHEYNAGGFELVVHETGEFMMITVERGMGDLLRLTRRDQVIQIEQAAMRILAVRGTFIGQDMEPQAYHWVFQFPPSITEGTRFSTDASKDVSMMWSWANRVDGGIHDGRVYFMAFKRREATDGRRVFIDMRHWFDGKCWAPYTNIKPRGK
jgi:hypothetical protein